MTSKSFSHLWVGIFFLISSFSLVILMWMFVFVWQPIWTAGFKDFHTISSAISQLDKTAQPVSETLPLMLETMSSMNHSMVKMQDIMKNMDSSMGNMEQMTPDIKKMTESMDQMKQI
ncbi:MAG: hypothetical protein HOM11_13125, partial [Methylococcales bacterium]|nr:hypothetical protein [Methylococcales bacterium]